MPRRRPAQLLPLIPASPAGWGARLQETPLLSVRAAGRQDRWLPTPRGPPQSIGRRAWPSPPAAPRTPRAGRRVDASRAPGTPALAGSRILPGRALLDGAAARRLAEAGRCPRCPGQLSGVWEPGRGEPARAGRGHVVAVRGREGLPTRGGPPSQSLSPPFPSPAVSPVPCPLLSLSAFCLSRAYISSSLPPPLGCALPLLIPFYVSPLRFFLLPPFHSLFSCPLPVLPFFFPFTCGLFYNSSK